jgi:hypothetical protein
MAVTVDSKIKDILADPTAADIVERHLPGFRTDRQMKMVYGLSLRSLAKFPQAKVVAEKLATLEKELAELA